MTWKSIVLWLACLIDDDVPLEDGWDLLDSVLQQAVMQFNEQAIEMARRA